MAHAIHSVDRESGLDTATMRLLAFEEISRRLWPFVRHFGLCGGHPDAVQAVVDLGRLIGAADDHNSLVANAGAVISRETVSKIEAFLQRHRFAGRHVRREHMQRLSDELRAFLTGQIAEHPLAANNESSGGEAPGNAEPPR